MDNGADEIRRGAHKPSAAVAEENGPVMPDFGILDAEPVTAAEIDAALAAGLGAAGIER